MNILGLVFSLLLILSYGVYASWGKHYAATQFHATYIAHEKAHRKILNRYQSEVYKTLGKIERGKEEKEIKSKPPKEKKEPPFIFNRECAKINLWPLIQEGREGNPELYELAAKLIRTFYHPKEKRFEYRLLDTLITKAKGLPSPVELEKLDLNDVKLQTAYYKMLKGTKKWNLTTNIGLPPFSHYFKAEETKTKLCICHANLDMMTALFNPAIANCLYSKIHQENAPLLTQELIERIYQECHQISPPLPLFSLLEFGYPHHKESEKTFTAEGSKKLLLRRTLPIR